MPTLTVAGHDVTVGDEFLKMSPEDQQSMVNHIAEHLPASKAEEPSGVVAGLQHGIAQAAAGDAKTIGLTGATTPTLDGMAKTAEPANYHSASLIRDGGHWYNPSDYQPSAIPQILAEQAPGLAQDYAAGTVAGKVGAKIGPKTAALAGLGGFAGSALLRTFGPGAQANADARTGTPNSPIATTDLTREGAKQAIELPLNMVGASRILPTSALAGSALKKYATTLGVEAATGAAGDVADQAATTAGSKDGLNVDLNRTATSALTRLVGSGVLAAPKLAAETNGNIVNKRFEADDATKAAATAVANRHVAAADGRDIVGPLGGTKVAQEVHAAVHGDIHGELATSAAAEKTLSQDNTNTLKRIQSGGTATPTELTALDAEASPQTASLARQAVISSQVKPTGGLSGAMDNLSLIKNPVKSVIGAGAGAIAGHTVLGGALGAVAPAALGTVFGTYGAARAFDKMAGTRSPMAGFADRFADGGAVRPDATGPAPDPYNPSDGPWGARVGEGPTGPAVAPPGAPVDPTPSLRATLNSNSKIDEGMAKIAKTLAAQKKASMIADALPALQQLAASRQAPAPAPVDPMIAAGLASKAMLKAGADRAKLIANSTPPEPAPPPAPVAPQAAPQIDPLNLPTSITRPIKNLVSAHARAAAMQSAHLGNEQADSIAASSPLIQEQGGLSALSNPNFAKRGGKLISAANVMRKLTAQPEEEAAATQVPDAPASPAISQLMQKIQAETAPKPAPAPVAPPQAPQTDPEPTSQPAGFSKTIAAYLTHKRSEPAPDPFSHETDEETAARMFPPREAPQPAQAPDLHGRIRSAYSDVVGNTGHAAMISAIRAKLPDVGREVLDHALKTMQSNDGAILMQHDFPRIMTPEEKAGALQIGSEPRHQVRITDLDYHAPRPDIPPASPRSERRGVKDDEPLPDWMGQIKGETAKPPVIATIKKKMGKPVEEAPHAEADKPYTPIAEEDLWRKHIQPTAEHSQDQLVAQQELASYGPTVVKKYSKNVIDNREAKRDFAEQVAMDHTPEDAHLASELYHQLDHISRRNEAKRAIKHYSRLMGDAASRAVTSHFTDKVMAKMWKSE